MVDPDRQPSDPVTPYVGRRARRDAVPEEHSERPAQPYVGKRAARPAADAAPVVPAPVLPAPATPYVGRRIARPVAEPSVVAQPVVAQPVVDQIVERAAHPAPPAIHPVIHPVIQPLPQPAGQATSGLAAEPAAEPVARVVPEPAVAFVKPVAPVALLDVPAPRTSEWTDWNLFAAESPEDPGQLPFALTEAFTGSLPRIEGEPGTDFTFDTTPSLPAVKPGKRARAGRRSRLRLLPSLPALVGVAAVAVAGFGTLTPRKDNVVQVEAGALRQAGALTGTSAVAAVGDRSVALSRGGGRSEANTAARAHESALEAINKKAAGWATVLKKNQWQLPVTPGVYHLTARFGDCGL